MKPSRTILIGLAAATAAVVAGGGTAVALGVAAGSTVPSPTVQLTRTASTDDPTRTLPQSPVGSSANTAGPAAVPTDAPRSSRTGDSSGHDADDSSGHDADDSSGHDADDGFGHDADERNHESRS